MPNESTPQFQFQSQGDLQEGNMIYLQMNRVNEALSHKIEGLEENKLKAHVYWVKQTIRTLEDNVHSFLDDEYEKEKEEALKDYEEADLQEKIDKLHKYYQTLENLLHRKRLWFSVKNYYEVTPVEKTQET